jgi:hypothetical protein
MQTATLTQVLLSCTIINALLLGVWGAVFVLPHAWLYRLTTRFFRVSADQLDCISFAGIVLYKTAILAFNVAPYIALRIAG